MYLSGFSLTDCSFWHKLIRLLPLFQDIQPAVGRCPVRAELSARRRTTSWAPGPWKRQSRFLPASGRAFCALHPNLQTAGESLWPGGPPSEEEIYSLSSWKCDGKSVRAEKWNGGERVFRVPLHGWCASWFEAHTCTFDFWVQDKNQNKLLHTGAQGQHSNHCLLWCPVRPTSRSPSLATFTVNAAKRCSKERPCWLTSWKWRRSLKLLRWVEKQPNLLKPWNFLA